MTPFPRGKTASTGGTGGVQAGAHGSQIGGGRKRADYHSTSNHHNASTARSLVKSTVVAALSHVSGLHPLLLSTPVVDGSLSLGATPLPLSSPPQSDIKVCLYAAMQRAPRRWRSMETFTLPQQRSHGFLTHLALNSTVPTGDYMGFSSVEPHDTTSELPTARGVCGAHGAVTRHRTSRPWGCSSARHCRIPGHRHHGHHGHGHHGHHGQHGHHRHSHAHCAHACCCRRSKGCLQQCVCGTNKKSSTSSKDRQPRLLSLPDYDNNLRADSPVRYDPQNAFYNGVERDYVGKSANGGFPLFYPRPGVFSSPSLSNFDPDPFGIQMGQGFKTVGQEQPWKTAMSPQDSSDNGQRPNPSAEKAEPPTQNPRTVDPRMEEQEQTPPFANTSKIPKPPPLLIDNLGHLSSSNMKQPKNSQENNPSWSLFPSWTEKDITYEVINRDKLERYRGWPELETSNVVKNNTDAEHLLPSHISSALKKLRHDPKCNVILPLTETLCIVKRNTHTPNATEDDEQEEQ